MVHRKIQYSDEIKGCEVEHTTSQYIMTISKFKYSNDAILFHKVIRELSYKKKKSYSRVFFCKSQFRHFIKLF